MTTDSKVSSTLTGGDFSRKLTSQNFTDEFKTAVFSLWYTNSEPTALELYKLFTEEQKVDPETGSYLEKSTLNSWIVNTFRTKASLLDERFKNQIDKDLVDGRVRMVKKHIEAFEKLEKDALDFIEEHGLGNARNALTAFFKAVELEREARGLPIGAFEEIASKDEKELADALREIAEKMKLTAPNENTTIEI